LTLCGDGNCVEADPTFAQGNKHLPKKSTSGHRALNGRP
jgi:hypothetical protein